jgi:hypothetical protein
MVVGDAVATFCEVENDFLAVGSVYVPDFRRLEESDRLMIMDVTIASVFCVVTRPDTMFCTSVMGDCSAAKQPGPGSSRRNRGSWLTTGHRWSVETPPAVEESNGA